MRQTQTPQKQEKHAPADLAIRRDTVRLCRMKKPNLVLICFAIVTTACGAAQPTGPTPIPEAMSDRCIAATRAFAALVEKGQHTPVTLTLHAGATSEKVSEAQLAQKIASGQAGGQIWLSGRAGSGKTGVADALEVALCEKTLTVRIDVATDLRPKFAAAGNRSPALAAVILQKLAVTGSDAAADLTQAIGAGPWVLLLDGTDDLSPRERRTLTKEFAWLAKSGVTQPRWVRFERTGFNEGIGGMAPEAVAELPELSCEQAQSVLKRRFDSAEKLAAAQAWLKAKGLDRQRSPDTMAADTAGACQYVYMATWRDAEILSDLADDAAKSMEDLPTTTTRAELYGAWLGHRLQPVAVSIEAALGWLDRLVALGVMDAAEPDLLLGQERCATAAPPGGTDAAAACGGLFTSPVVRPGPDKFSSVLRSQAIADLLLARWLTPKYSDCLILAAHSADLGSLEATSMILAQPSGRRCIVPLVAAVCSRGLDAREIARFVDEALPRNGDFSSAMSMASTKAGSACERAVYAALYKPDAK